MVKRRIFLMAAAASLAACGRGETRRFGDVEIAADKRGQWALATLPADSAIRIAQARIAGGKVTKGELEEEDGRLIFSLDLATPGKPGIDELHIDARTGEVVKTAHEGG